MTENVYGVDIAKDWVDVATPKGRHLQLRAAQYQAFARDVERAGGHVVFEATGSYDLPFRRALGKENVSFSRVNPQRARAFAQSLGLFAKTDRLDAFSLREMGQRLKLRTDVLESENILELKALHARRRQLVELRKGEKTRLLQAFNTKIKVFIRAIMDLLQQQIAQIEAQISTLIKQDDALQIKASRLASAPGVGPVTVAAILCECPEIGRIKAKPLAALAGLAPMARDSGYRRNKRHIKGGRKPLRDILYMAALSAGRHNPDLRKFKERLLENGKSPKQAIIAVARKLLIILNAMIRDEKDFTSQN